MQSISVFFNLANFLISGEIMLMSSEINGVSHLIQIFFGSSLGKASSLSFIIVGNLWELLGRELFCPCNREQPRKGPFWIGLSIGVLGNAESYVPSILAALGFNKKEVWFLMKKIVSCSTRGAYYVFCMRNNGRSKPSIPYWWHVRCHSVRTGHHTWFNWVVYINGL